MNGKTHYETLEVPPNATYGQIRKSYRRLAKKHHPDKNLDGMGEGRFAEIAQAYAVLSDFKKRKQYDFTLSRPQASQDRSGSGRPYYSGYPWFRYDFFTPLIHRFFMGESAPTQSVKDMLRAIVLNYRILLVSVLGALCFFKFFSAISGTVIEKRIESGLFNNISYNLLVETAEGDQKKKRVKAELYSQVEEKDRVEKRLFSFPYRVNDREISMINTPRFLLQTGMIYLFISGGLLLLEYW